MNRTLLLASLVLFGCHRATQEPTPTAPPAPSTPPAMDPHSLLITGAAGENSIHWEDPPAWAREEPSSPMRRAQYRIPRSAGDPSDAQLAVFTFGNGQGGDVQSNLARWFGQVQQPDGRPSSDVAERLQITIGPFHTTLIDVAGRVTGTGMGMGAPAAPTIENGRLLAAVVETPEGDWFFKMTGPDRTVEAARPAFETMLRSIRSDR